jgi:enamine deaminase RidA (YjgF/YER057c/UK114 family)
MVKDSPEKRGPGRPRKGLAKTSVSLRPEQLEALRSAAAFLSAFGEQRDEAVDVSSLVRIAIDDSPRLQRVMQHMRTLLQETLDVPAHAAAVAGAAAVRLREGADALDGAALHETFRVAVALAKYRRAGASPAAQQAPSKRKRTP